MKQHGFTLLELMVAMAIFAMLAVAGWQVFDSVNRARERAQGHADNLAGLQYAYLQLQQDMGQIIPYQAPPTQTANNNTANGNNNASNNVNPNQNNAIAATPFMTVEGARLSFMRYADPDPRYQTSPSIQRIEYVFSEESLIRRQYTTLQNQDTSQDISQNINLGMSQDISLDTVLLDGISEGSWQAYLPELSAKFPNTDFQNSTQNNDTTQTGKQADAALLLPKGVGIRFTYQEMPISWQWALTPQPAPDDNASNNNNPPNTNNSNNNNNAAAPNNTAPPPTFTPQ